MRKNPFFKIQINWHFVSVCETLGYSCFAGMVVITSMQGLNSPAWIGGGLAVIYVGLILANLYHYHIMTTKPLQKPKKTALDPHLVSFSLKPGGLSHFEALGQRYRIKVGEYRVLFRSPKSPPNEWIFSHWDGAWVVLQNCVWKNTTCAILPKHVEKV
jgi:hypothetical protein